MTPIIFVLGGAAVVWLLFKSRDHSEAIAALKGSNLARVHEHNAANVKVEKVISALEAVEGLSRRLGKLETVVFGTLLDDGTGTVGLGGGLTHKTGSLDVSLAELGKAVAAIKKRSDRLTAALTETKES